MYLTFYRQKTNNHVQLNRSNYTVADLFEAVEYIEPEVTVAPRIREDFETTTVITDRFPANMDDAKLNQILQELKQLTREFQKETLLFHYATFYIPKATFGQYREINAPDDQLMDALRRMKDIFQYKLNVLYHNSAFAYVPHRSIKHALEKHTRRNSKWFLKLDIKNFFPSCNQEFVVKMLRKIYPFSYYSEEDLNSFMWLCFRLDQLPQGTPMSPMLTNLLMIPIDYAIEKFAQENNLVYTRYADDILLSSGVKWDWQLTVQSVNTIFRTMGTPFSIKDEKTRFGSSAGRNWNLGLMVNKDNNITVGYRNKKKYRAAIDQLFTVVKETNDVDREDLQHFQGVTAYYLSIEPEYFQSIIRRYEQKYNLNLKDIYKRFL
jgi:hypothetical protein